MVQKAYNFAISSENSNILVFNKVRIFFIHARFKENIEKNLKAYISAMRGSIDKNSKLMIEIFDGKRKDIFLNFTLNSNDFIDIIKSLPLQTTSFVHWAGFNFNNLKANIQIFKTFSSMMIKAVRFDTINYKKLPKFLDVLARFVPQQLYELIKEDISNFNNNERNRAFQGNLMKNLANSAKNLLYKQMSFPFTVLVSDE